jgi:hypothetical protein
MPRRQRAARDGGGGCGGAAEDVKMEDFVESMLNFGGGGGDESEDGEQQQPPAGEATEFKSKNLDAERRRRGRLNTNILALRAVVPNITKVLTVTDACFLTSSSDLIDFADHPRHRN